MNRLRGRVAEGKANTILGTFNAGDLADGTRVKVLFRPEGILLGPVANGQGIRARILSSRLLGNTSQIRLALEEADAHTEPLLVRVPGVFLPAHDTVVSVTVDAKKNLYLPGLKMVYGLSDVRTGYSLPISLSLLSQIALGYDVGYTFICCEILNPPVMPVWFTVREAFQRTQVGFDFVYVSRL